MATEIEKPVVERLDVDNYATWRTRMKFLLISKGLWHAITGDDANVDNDQKALALIGLYVKEHHLPLMERCTTAKEAWLLEMQTYLLVSSLLNCIISVNLWQDKCEHIPVLLCSS